MNLKQSILLLSLLSSLCCYGQTFPQHHFKYNGDCNLVSKMENTQSNGDKVSVYECLIPSSSSVVTAYRVNVITFKNSIYDVDEYYRKLRTEYSKQGTATNVTLNGKRAVQCEEVVDIQGHAMKQISIAVLYRNKSITLVLVSNDDAYLKYLQAFKSNFSFL